MFNKFNNSILQGDFYRVHLYNLNHELTCNFYFK